MASNPCRQASSTRTLGQTVPSEKTLCVWKSHFKVTIVSDAFAGRRLVERHRAVNDTLAGELSGPVHALSLHALTPDEWFARGGAVPESPPCLGGSKAS